MAKPTLAAVWASESARTKAVQKAASVCPLGKLLLEGVRTVASRWSSGRWRSTAVFTTRLTMSEENPAAARATTARRRSGPRRRALTPASSDPDEPVVGQVRHDGGGAVGLGLPRSGSKAASTASSIAVIWASIVVVVIWDTSGGGESGAGRS